MEVYEKYMSSVWLWDDQMTASVNWRLRYTRPAETGEHRIGI